jgi:hypothetical protein
MEIYQVTGGLDIALVAERPGGALCGFVEASVRPFAEGSDARPVGTIEGWYVDSDGIVIIRARSQDEAHAMVKADPAVLNGVMSAELHLFRVSLMGRKAP